MTENQKQYLADIIGSLLAGVLLTEALTRLIPEGLWLYLIYLVVGTVIITNKLNRILRGN
jgi:uncharacterized membrane protein YeaQ/YmgE (transglycosylase-associated protein family)